MISDRNLLRRRHTHIIYAKEFLGVGAVSASAAANTLSAATINSSAAANTLSASTINSSAAANTLSSATIATTLTALTLVEGTPNTYPGTSTLTSTLSALTLTTGAVTSTLASLTLTAGAVTSTLASLTLTAGAVTGSLITLAAGANSFAEVGTLSYGGLLFTSNAQFVRHIMPVLPQVDWSNDVYFRVCWSSTSTTTTDSILWKILTKAYALNSVPASGAVTVGTALDVAIAADTKANTTASVLQKTTWGKMNKDTVDPGTQDLLLIDVEALTFTGLTDATLLWLEMQYVPKYSSDNEKHLVQLPAPTDA